MKNEIVRLNPSNNRIRKLRMQSGKGQVELANLLGIDKSILNRHELAVGKMQLEILARLADYFDVSLDYIAGRTSRDLYDPDLVVDYSLPIDYYDTVASALDVAQADERVTTHMVEQLSGNPSAMRAMEDVVRRRLLEEAAQSNESASVEKSDE